MWAAHNNLLLSPVQHGTLLVLGAFIGGLGLPVFAVHILEHIAHLLAYSTLLILQDGSLLILRACKGGLALPVFAAHVLEP